MSVPMTMSHLEGAEREGSKFSDISVITLERFDLEWPTLVR